MNPNYEDTFIGHCKKMAREHPILMEILELRNEHIVTTGTPNEYYTTKDDDRVRILLAFLPRTIVSKTDVISERTSQWLAVTRRPIVIDDGGIGVGIDLADGMTIDVDSIRHHIFLTILDKEIEIERAKV